MSFTRKVIRRIVALKAPKDVLSRELYYVRRAAIKSEKRAEWYHENWSGCCCPYCEFPILGDIEAKRDRQLEHISLLESKIRRRM